MPAKPLELPEGWETVTEDGHVIKKIDKEGTGFITPKDGAKVEVHYTGRLVSNGDKFDSSRDRGDPFSFKLGVGQVIKGWDVGVKTMKRGEVSTFRFASDYGYGKGGSGAKIPGDADLEFDIELLDWNSKEDLTGKKEIMKETLMPGEGYKKPSDCSKVTISLKVKYQDQVVEENPNLEFTVGEESVQRGIDKAVQSMTPGEKAIFDVKPNWAYGSEGCSEKNIPPNAEIQYEIELLKMDKERETWDMENLEKIEYAKTKKDQGNAFFKEGKLSIAAKRYDMGLSAIKYSNDWEDNERQLAEEIQVSLNLNIAVIKSKSKEWSEVLKHAENALKIQPNNLKALYRQGIAMSETDNWNDAERTFNKGLELEPDNKDFKRELAKLKKRVKLQNDRDKRMYQKMFQ